MQAYYLYISAYRCEQAYRFSPVIPYHIYMSFSREIGMTGVRFKTSLEDSAHATPWIGVEPGSKVSREGGPLHAVYVDLVDKLIARAIANSEMYAQLPGGRQPPDAFLLREGWMFSDKQGAGVVWFGVIDDANSPAVQIRMARGPSRAREHLGFISAGNIIHDADVYNSATLSLEQDPESKKGQRIVLYGSPVFNLRFDLKTSGRGWLLKSEFLSGATPEGLAFEIGREILKI